MGLGHLGIGDEFVYLGNPVLIDVDHGIEPTDDTHQLKEQ
jgi:hypothetical protein